MKKISITFIVILFMTQACASPTPERPIPPTVTPTVPVVVPTETPVKDTAARLAELGGVP